LPVLVETSTVIVARHWDEIHLFASSFTTNYGMSL
jgi:hypothetical protein